MYRPIINY